MPKYLTAIIIGVIVLLAGAGIWWFLNAQPNSAPTEETTQTPTTTTNETKQESDTNSGSTVIIFTNNGFEKSSYTAKVGDTVTVRNTSSLVVEFSSDDHPTHRENPELNLQALQPGQEATLTAKTAGTWGIHDHEHPEFTTTLVVAQ